MTVSIGIRFPAGRFSATPWGRHENEGVPEWPPSPWRLIRGLVSAWKVRLRGEKVSDEVVKSIISKLAETLPEFYLPPYSIGHTRHQMPVYEGGSPKGKSYLEYTAKKRKLIFDTFVVLDREDPVIVSWPNVTLTDEERDALKLLLSHLLYLGRAESWCEAFLVDEDYYQGSDDKIECKPVLDPSRDIERYDEDKQLIQVLVPSSKDAQDPSLAWNGWAYKKKKSTQPKPLWNILSTTLDAQEGGWQTIPGSMWMDYVMIGKKRYLRDKQRGRLMYAREVLGPEEGYRCAVYRLDGPVLPKVEDSIYIGELVRRTLQGRYGRLYDGASSPVFSGKDENGRPLHGHSHCYYVSLDMDGDGKIDHVIVYCKGGFSSKEIEVLGSVGIVFYRQDAKIEMVLVDLVDDYNLDKSVHTRYLFDSSEVWRSITPFVPSRNYKKRGRKRDTCTLYEFPKIVLMEQLTKNGFPSPSNIEEVDPLRTIAKHGNKWRYFRQRRVLGNGSRGVIGGAGFRIRFDKPVRGPIILGYGAHFGLGAFIHDRCSVE